MKYEVGVVNVPPKNKYPYLGVTTAGDLVLVGKYCAIRLDPKGEGYGYLIPDRGENITRAPEGTVVTLTQERE